MNANIRFEIIAEAFYKMTGHMAPGKDSPVGSLEDYDIRKEAWDKWYSSNLEIIEAMINATSYILELDDES